MFQESYVFKDWGGGNIPLNQGNGKKNPYRDWEHVFNASKCTLVDHFINEVLSSRFYCVSSATSNVTEITFVILQNSIQNVLNLNYPSHPYKCHNVDVKWQRHAYQGGGGVGEFILTLSLVGKLWRFKRLKIWLSFNVNAMAQLGLVLHLLRTLIYEN